MRYVSLRCLYASIAWDNCPSWNHWSRSHASHWLSVMIFIESWLNQYCWLTTILALSCQGMDLISSFLSFIWIALLFLLILLISFIVILVLNLLSIYLIKTMKFLLCYNRSLVIIIFNVKINTYFFKISIIHHLDLFNNSLLYFTWFCSRLIHF